MIVILTITRSINIYLSFLFFLAICSLSLFSLFCNPHHHFMSCVHSVVSNYHPCKTQCAVIWIKESVVAKNLSQRLLLNYSRNCFSPIRDFSLMLLIALSGWRYIWWLPSLMGWQYWGTHIVWMWCPWVDVWLAASETAMLARPCSFCGYVVTVLPAWQEKLIGWAEVVTLKEVCLIGWLI